MSNQTPTPPTRRSVLAGAALLMALPATVLAGETPLTEIPPELVLFVDSQGRIVLDYDEATGRAKVFAARVNDDAVGRRIPSGGVLTLSGDGQIPRGAIAVRLPRSVVQAACEGSIEYLERNGWAFLVRSVVLGIPA